MEIKRSLTDRCKILRQRSKRQSKHRSKQRSKQRWQTYFLIVGSVFSVIGASAQVSEEEFPKALADAAFERTNHAITYDGRYFKIDFPDGDVPSHLGVCTDVVVRSFRSLGIDLQLQVHEDIKTNFNNYPAKRIWGQKKPDTNIDHRRVPNLATFFSRHGETLAISENKDDYHPGNIVTWKLANNLPHIGIVANQAGPTGNPLIIHNIGAGPVMEDVLFSYTITGHFRYKNRSQNDTMRHIENDL